jgi:putative oxidoreductase
MLSTQLLLARLGLGVLMVAHAKLEYDFAAGSITGVGVLFEESGIPLAAITGPANVLFEFAGGAAMILGLAVRLVAFLMALNMVGAWIFVHTGGLYALDHTGPELVIALGLLSLVLVVSGSGRLGLDRLIVRRVVRLAHRLTGRRSPTAAMSFALPPGLTRCLPLPDGTHPKDPKQLAADASTPSVCRPSHQRRMPQRVQQPLGPVQLGDSG